MPGADRLAAICRVLNIRFSFGGQDASGYYRARVVAVDEKTLAWCCKQVLCYLKDEHLLRHAKPSEIAALIANNYKIAARHASETAEFVELSDATKR